ncbi:hypothetical protein [Alteromonas sp. CYL-A6]|uniref:hypothetical protein n=1 Tax=Alteromonas nitratireducens TaxID=3390813 RepID=UPI0034C4ED23
MQKFEWTHVSDAFLRENWVSMRVVDIATALGVSKYAVLRRARTLELDKKGNIGATRPNDYAWTCEQDGYLKSNYYIQTNEELAEYFNVSVQAVMRRAKMLGLKKSAGVKHHKWSSHDLRILIDRFYQGVKLTDIASELDVSLQAVKRKLKSEGFSRRKKMLEK